MRLMIDTQIFVFLAQDVLSLSHDVRELLSDYSNTLHISAESVKELIVAYNNKRLFTNKWKSANFHSFLVPKVSVLHGARFRFNLQQEIIRNFLCLDLTRRGSGVFI